MKDKKNYVRYDLVKRYKDLNSIIKMYKTQLSNLQSEDNFHTFNQNSMFIGNFYSIIKKIIIVNYYDTGEALKKKEIALFKSSI